MPAFLSLLTGRTAITLRQRSAILYQARFRLVSRLKSDTPSSSADKSKNTNAVAHQDQHRSILEEVLIKEKQKPTTFAGKAAEKAQNTFLYAIVAGSVALVGAFAYYLCQEFFAEDSPQHIFAQTLDLVRADPRCQDIFGSSMKGFGEETSRGRRRHVAHHKYFKNGNERIRIMFHIKGDENEGICQAEKEYKDGSWLYRFVLVETRGTPRATHVLIDNRTD